jgi:uncharacterized membrane protein
MKVLVIVMLFAIVASLGKALFAMSSGDSGHSRDMVRALTMRIALSVALFILLIVGGYLGLIDPHGLR